VEGCGMVWTHVEFGIERGQAEGFWLVWGTSF